VLARVSLDERDLLVRGSALDRLSGPLCDAVLGRDGCAALLERLSRTNVFVIPLDQRREWYRLPPALPGGAARRVLPHGTGAGGRAADPGRRVVPRGRGR
jgi:ATP/maltotriose-dependent transcriptional regulator MalT